MFLKRIQPSMNVLTAMTAGILAYGGWRLIHARMEHQYAIKATQQEVLRFKSELRLRSSLMDAELSSSGWVSDIDPSWFKNPPRNHLLNSGHTWLEMAEPGESALQHPRERDSDDSSNAAWWYNPANGALRARVPTQTSSSSLDQLYHLIND